MNRAWTLPGLVEVQSLARAGDSLDEIAGVTGRFKPEIDRALWALVGRSPEQALERLNREATDPAPEPPPARRPVSAVLREFVREVLR